MLHESRLLQADWLNGHLNNGMPSRVISTNPIVNLIRTHQIQGRTPNGIDEGLRYALRRSRHQERLPYHSMTLLCIKIGLCRARIVAGSPRQSPVDSPTACLKCESSCSVTCILYLVSGTLEDIPSVGSQSNGRNVWSGSQPCHGSCNRVVMCDGRANAAATGL